MCTHQLAQWKPGDFFAIQPTVVPRFFRNQPFTGNQEGNISPTMVNINLIYVITAVYEESTWTAIKFHNQHAIENLRDPVRPENAEHLWTIARDMDHQFCYHINIRNGLLRPHYWDHLIHHPYIPYEPVASAAHLRLVETEWTPADRPADISRSRSRSRWEASWKYGEMGFHIRVCENYHPPKS